MTMTAANGHTTINIAPRKIKGLKAADMNSVVEVPTLTPSTKAPVAVERQAKPSVVSMARTNSDAEAQAALMKLRELVVGPAQQLNEARLEELIRIFEEREIEMKAALRDIQQRNTELEIALKQNFLEQLNSLRNEFLAITDGMTVETKKMGAGLREEIDSARKEAVDLANESNASSDQKLKVQTARLEGMLKAEANKLHGDLMQVNSDLQVAQTVAQNETQNNISRVLKEASENLIKAVSAK